MRKMEELVAKIKNVDIELTYSCNLNCLHCYNPTHKRSLELSTGKVKSVIYEVASAGFPEVHLNGGEPLLRRDINEILGYCNGLGLRTLLETNAVLLTDSEPLSKLENLTIRASIDGPERVHNEIRRNRRSGNPYRAAVSNLSEAAKNGINVQITCSVNRVNYFSIYEMVEDLLSNGLDNIRLRLSMPCGFAFNNWDRLKLNKQEFERLVSSNQRIVDEFHNVRFDYSSLRRGTPQSEPKFFVEPGGFVKPYPFIEYFIGDLNQESVKSVLSKVSSSHFPNKYEKMIVFYLNEIGMVIENE